MCLSDFFRSREQTEKDSFDGNSGCRWSPWASSRARSAPSCSPRTATTIPPLPRTRRRGHRGPGRGRANRCATSLASPSHDAPLIEQLFGQATRAAAIPSATRRARGWRITYRCSASFAPDRINVTCPSSRSSPAPTSARHQPTIRRSATSASRRCRHSPWQQPVSVCFDDVCAAAARIAQQLSKRRSHLPSQAVGAGGLRARKGEHLPRCGSFKLRSALNRPPMCLSPPRSSAA